MADPQSGDLNRRALLQSASQSASRSALSSVQALPTQASPTQASVTPISRRQSQARTAPVSRRRGQVSALQSTADANEAVVHSFPQQKPLWLMILLRVQQSSFLVTFGLIVGAMVVYGWTVYIQQRWGQEYEKLEVLKKQERQLISANEVLKNQMAEQAESPTAGLLLPNPNNAIFLAPAPQRPAVKPSSPLVAPANTASKRPLGY